MQGYGQCRLRPNGVMKRVGEYRDGEGRVCQIGSVLAPQRILPRYWVTLRESGGPQKNVATEKLLKRGLGSSERFERGGGGRATPLSGRRYADCNTFFRKDKCHRYIIVRSELTGVINKGH